MTLQAFAPTEHNFQNYRSADAVAMKLQNIRYHDDHRTGGLSGGGKLDGIILSEFYNNREELAQLAKAITSVATVELPTGFGDEKEDESAMEGSRLQKVHFFLERSRKLVSRKKQQVLNKNGKLVCEVCHFDFYAFYGEPGLNFIECHHIIPLSQLKRIHLTRLSDYMLLCANCHRMIHRIKNCDLGILKNWIESAKSQHLG